MIGNERRSSSFGSPLPEKLMLLGGVDHNIGDFF
jgi:hypothetical protein